MNPAFEPTQVLGAPRATVASWNPPAWLPPAGRALAALLAVAALLLAVLAAVTPPLAQPESALACAVLALAVLRVGVAAERRLLAARGLIDAATGLHSPQALEELGTRMLAQCRREGRPVAMAVLDFADLAEVRAIYGREICHRVLLRVVGKLQAAAGEGGLAARTGKTQFTLLLPGASRERAAARIERVLGRPGRIEFDAGDSEIVLVPDLLLESAAPDVETIGELHLELASALAQERRREQRRQHWLQRERERHSRPMGLPPAA